MLSILVSILSNAGPSLAGETCPYNCGYCVASAASKTGTGWNIHVTFRGTSTTGDCDVYHVLFPGQPQREVNCTHGGTDEFDFAAPADWNGQFQVQACIKHVYRSDQCDTWEVFKTDLPTTAVLTSPNPDFCNWYASEAVARAAQGAKCGFTGARWDPDKQHHFDWCMQQKSQQEGWSEHNARLGDLADCAKKEAANAPPKANQGMGPPTPTVPQDVDVYAQPGGKGKSIGTLKGGSRIMLTDQRPDQWCHVAGDPVPTGQGWVWCGKGFELK